MTLLSPARFKAGDLAFRYSLHPHIDSAVYEIAEVTDTNELVFQNMGQTKLPQDNFITLDDVINIHRAQIDALTKKLQVYEDMKGKIA